MSYRFTDDQYAKLYNVTPRTIRNWKRKSAPLDNPDPNAMALFKIRERSRRGVSKNSRRSTSIAPFKIAQAKPEPEQYPLDFDIVAAKVVGAASRCIDQLTEIHRLAKEGNPESFPLIVELSAEFGYE
jgi:hypothetical protein